MSVWWWRLDARATGARRRVGALLLAVITLLAACGGSGVIALTPTQVAISSSTWAQAIHPIRSRTTGLGVPMFFSHFDAETNHRLIQSAGFKILDAKVIAEEEDGQQVKFLWVTARKPSTGTRHLISQTDEAVSG